MKVLKIYQEMLESGHSKYSFVGSINENLDISIGMKEKLLIFDFGQVEQINSSGILKFINFLSTLNADQAIQFINVPDIVVNVMSLTKGILSTRFRIESFYVPFYCIEIDRQDYKLFSTIEFDRSSISSYRDTEGNLFEVDTNLERYLHFLLFQK